MEKAKIITENVNIEAAGDGAMGWAMEALKEIGRPFVQTMDSELLKLHSPDIMLDNVEDAQIGDYIKIILNDGRVARFDVTDRGDDWIRFDSHDCIGETPWNENGSNEGVWSSDAQKYLKEKIWPLMPYYLTRRIIETERHFMNGGGDDAAEETFKTELFLPDASELFKRDDDWYAPVYEQMDYYKDRRNRMKAAEPEGTEMDPWWTASACSGTATGIVLVNAYGNSLNTTASDTNIRVPICFRISAKRK